MCNKGHNQQSQKATHRFRENIVSDKKLISRLYKQLLQLNNNNNNNNNDNNNNKMAQ